MLELKKDQTIIIEGDSGTNLRTGPGYGTWPFMRMMGFDQNWADKFAELMFCWYPELNLKIRNLAVGGAKSSCLLDRFDSFVKPNNPDWVFFTIGGNDIAVGLTNEESQANMEKYIKKIQKECDANVVYITGLKPCPFATEKLIESAQIRKERFDAISETVKKCGGYVIDIGTGLQEKALELEKQWEGHTVYCSEKRDSHFNAVGHMIIAGEVMKGLGYIK